MQICRSIAETRAAVAAFRADGASVGLVTTMGALHEGHMALVATARGENDRVVATIFVNPAQFGDPKDLQSYPRAEAQDLALLEEAGVDAVFLPEIAEIYPEGHETVVEPTRLANTLLGLVRPGHFRGVATVVAKLFNIVQPDAAYFGEKDYQQLAVIRRMARDLHLPLRIRGVPTVRAPDGLALSSRNARLAPEDRAAATVLNRSLDAAQAVAVRGVPITDIERVVRDTIAAEPRARLEAVDIAAARTLAPVAGVFEAALAIMISARFGEVLLIDQRELGP